MEQIVKHYKDVFHGLRDIGGYKIDLDIEAESTQDAPRTVLVALKAEVKHIEEMTKAGILKKETGPTTTDWVNSAVYVKKPGKLIRPCLDLQQ